MLLELFVYFSAATNGYCHYQIIYWLFLFRYCDIKLYKDQKKWNWILQLILFQNALWSKLRSRTQINFHLHDEENIYIFMQKERKGAS